MFSLALSPENGIFSKDASKNAPPKTLWFVQNIGILNIQKLR